MRGKLLFVAGAAVGYVLGARAGRKRYEQIKGAAAKVWESPGIQRQVHQVQDYAARKVGDIPGALMEGAKKTVSAIVSRASEGSRDDRASGKALVVTEQEEDSGPPKEDSAESEAGESERSRRVAAASAGRSSGSTARAGTRVSGGAGAKAATGGAQSSGTKTGAKGSRSGGSTRTTSRKTPASHEE